MKNSSQGNKKVQQKNLLVVREKVSLVKRMAHCGCNVDANDFAVECTVGEIRKANNVVRELMKAKGEVRVDGKHY